MAEDWADHSKEAGKHDGRGGDEAGVATGDEQTAQDHARSYGKLH